MKKFKQRNMKTTIKLFLIFYFPLMCVCSLSALGQTQDKITAHDTTATVVKKAKAGTYQFIRISKTPEVFTTEYMDVLLAMIETNRHATEERILFISDYTKIKILPLSVINAPGFIPIEEYIDEGCPTK